ncbi:prolipoprotein diacylglyceryl transferase [Clostridium perfringens]|uniref:prolipoprotein diacylglyceryl transferase n=1 Tax=Clostridium perfringens TaxID=1502 RepID=UPI000BBAD02F|nr:prolipoprotein diacylglyceryl transferase [Clostridium perfringens]
MNPVAFSIGSFEVRWYGIIIALGILIAMTLVSINAKKNNLNFDVILDLFLWCFPFAIIGARAYYVLFELENYHSFWDMINIRQGGLAIHGGIIGAFLTAFIYCKVKKVDFLAYADIVAPAFILAQGIGRWGNFFNKEAHGGQVTSEFISKFPEFIQKGMYINGAYYHPTFLYESIWDIFVAIVLMIILYNITDRYKGVVISAYISLYSLGRFFIEGLRTDSLYFMNIRVAQLVSLLGIIIGIVAIIIIVSRGKKNRKGIFIN